MEGTGIDMVKKVVTVEPDTTLTAESWIAILHMAKHYYTACNESETVERIDALIDGWQDQLATL